MWCLFPRGANYANDDDDAKPHIHSWWWWLICCVVFICKLKFANLKCKCFRILTANFNNFTRERVQSECRVQAVCCVLNCSLARFGLISICKLWVIIYDALIHLKTSSANANACDGECIGRCFWFVFVILVTAASYFHCLNTEKITKQTHINNAFC